MSHHNKGERNYELVDVDVSIASVDDDHLTAETTVVATADDSMQPPTLPTGQVINGKNTLQSFEAYDGSPASMPPLVERENAADPRLPNGAVINAKNTLQSFGIRGRTNPPASINPEWNPMEAVKRPAHDESLLPNPILATPPPPATVVAVAVDANLVYAEVAPELVPSAISLHHHGNDNSTFTTAAVPWVKGRSTSLALLAIFAVSLALGLGLFFGLAASDGTNNRFPSAAPIANIPTSVNPTMEMAPSDPNLSTRAMVLTSYINNITLSNQMITANGTSPESKALAWMITNDTTLDTSSLISQDFPISRNTVVFHIQQRYSLLVMWFQQTATEKWAITTGWLVDPNECTWYGITCAATTVYYNDLVQTDDFVGGIENAVVEISFTNLAGSYVGILPVDIALLTHLQHFEIKNTYSGYSGVTSSLKGSLPDSISRWTALTHFDVSNNALSGTLPDSISQWTALTYFDVSYNSGLIGTFPDIMGQWTALMHFDVSNNFALTGSIPYSIGNWTSLVYFDICRNSFTGSIPNSISQLTALTHFAADVNGLNGTLPDSIGKWTSLTYFDASSNYLTGTIPYNVGKWTSLAYFGLYDDKLNGTLPEIIGYWTALTFFTVGVNGLSGTIPSSIGNWSLIENADFSANELAGSMPNVICQYVDIGTDILQVDCSVNCTCCTDYCI